MTLLYAVLLAHFLSDFVLQTDKLVEGKREASGRAYGAHGLVLTLTVVALSWLASGHLYVGLSVSVGLAHVIQDWTKEHLTARGYGGGPMWLAADQVVHLAVIGVLLGAFGLLRPLSLASGWLAGLHDPTLFAACMLAILGTWVAGVMLRELLAPLLPSLPSPDLADGRAGSQAMAEVAAAATTGRAGSPSTMFVRISFWIGIVERVIVIAAVAMAGGQGLATAGLVVAAKSIFRWRDRDSDPQAVQYFLLGTLSSIAVAVLTGLILRRMLR